MVLVLVNLSVTLISVENVLTLSRMHLLDDVPIIYFRHMVSSLKRVAISSICYAPF
jgi:hypothetical protein